jgi:hypothetical protein
MSFYTLVQVYFLIIIKTLFFYILIHDVFEMRDSHWKK